MSNRLSYAIGAVLLLTAAGCDDDPAAPATTGRVAVETVTTGASLDADGFVVSVAGGPGRAIGVNASLTVFDVEPGARTIELTDLAPNCAVSGPNPREVTVAAGETVTVRVEVSCEGVGTLEIRTATGGLSLDADGYEVSVNGGEATPLALNATVTLGFVPPGAASVELRNVAGNCEVVGQNPREIVVAVDEVAPTEFTVSCEAAGSIEVTTSTSGFAYDIEGYTAVVAGGPEQSVGYAGTVRLDYLAVGTQVVELIDVAPNCIVSGANPRSVGVALDAVTPVRFDVTCVTPYIGRILVLSDREMDGQYEVLILDEEGNGYLSPLSGRGAYTQAAVSPEGGRIAFVENYGFGYGSDIFVLKMNTGEVVNLTGNNGNGDEATHPSWSPQGTRVLFASDSGGDFDLYAVDPDGANLTTILAKPGRQWEGSWSPDGSRILFTAEDGDIWVADADGSGEERLTDIALTDIEYLSGPTWSPDGSRIAFGAGGEGVAGIYVMNADGSNLTNLTDPPDWDFSPSWSPDGTRLLFGTHRDGDVEVYIMNADGTAPTNLTKASLSFEYPGSPQSWR